MMKLQRSTNQNQKRKGKGIAREGVKNLKLHKLVVTCH